LEKDRNVLLICALVLRYYRCTS